jgi:hypothetical protein
VRPMTTRRRRRGEQSQPIVVGVCAMAKKVCMCVRCRRCPGDQAAKVTVRVRQATSAPMKEMLARIAATADFEVVVFSEAQILQDPVDRWPVCDSLICFYSTGFPLAKVGVPTAPAHPPPRLPAQ